MIRELIGILKSKGYKVYDRPFQLNIVGIRSAQTLANKFDDELHVFFKDMKNRWLHTSYPITTDPGTYWLLHPIQVDGTAILKEGQYKDAYHIGLHRGQYVALVEAKPVTVIRDYDRNAVLDFFNGKETTGYYGINIHHASQNGKTGNVDKWSAGCQVFQNIADFEQFMRLCNKHRNIYGNSFTYTLIDTRAVKRMHRRYAAYGAGVAALIGGILYLTLKD